MSVWKEWLSLKEQLLHNIYIFEYNLLVHNVIQLGYGMHPTHGVDYGIYYDT
jgi:hypothetical protein